ncbi:MAG: uroporphyrinogen decarboxylase family protein [Candidatus Helarchaeota archaeon]
MPFIAKALDEMVHPSKLTNFGIRILRGLHQVKRAFRFKEKKAFNANKDLLFERIKRILMAVELKIPDRVPISLACSLAFPALYSGYTVEEFLYDPRKNEDAFFKFVSDFPGEAYFPSFFFQIGKLVEAAGLRFIKIPGRDLEPNVGYQFVERELLEPNAYNEFGLNYFKEKILPELTDLASEHPAKGVSMFKTMRYAFGYISRILHNLDRAESLGVPMLLGSFTMQPFDMVSLLLRGLRGVSLDVRKYPEEVRRICDKLARTLLNMALQSAKLFKRELHFPEAYNFEIFEHYKSKKENMRQGVFFVCERAFMLNPKQFEEIAFPSLNYVVRGLVDANLIPILSFEQDVTHLLPIIRKLPGPGKVVFNCDLTDIVKAKEILGDHICIMGNVPHSLLTVGSPKQIEKYCIELIEKIGVDGGFILGAALAIPDEAKPENVKAMIDAGMKYGVYRQ